MTPTVAIIVKSGIVLNFADFAIFDPISDDGEWYSPGMCSRRDHARVAVVTGVLTERGGLRGTQR
jgi:hypothetical protein